METAAPLTLFNSLTRTREPFVPLHDGEARVYTCGPTVYNYPHIGNMRAYVFADTLERTLSYKGYKLTHVINITDVRGRQVLVPVSTFSYLEIGPPEARRVGFGAE